MINIIFFHTRKRTEYGYGIGEEKDGKRIGLWKIYKLNRGIIFLLTKTYYL